MLSVFRNSVKTMKKQRVLSGVKPTGRPHLGNYFGAMKQFVDLQQDNENFIFIADYHALTLLQDAKKLREYIFGIACDYLAIGLDPKKTTLFQQSQISAHTELAWIFNCLTPFAELTRAHAYKDAVAKGEKLNVGTFEYPVLMSADILLYDIDLVPVGRDQAQHLETTSVITRKFNSTFGETFKAPKGYILQNVEVVPGLDGRKMGKSYDNYIGIFEETDVLRKKIFSIKTGSEKMGEPLNPEKDILFSLHKLFATPEELANLANRYKKGEIGYKQSKELLFERAEAFIAPLREKRKKIASNPKKVMKIIDAGTKKAAKIAEKKLKEIKIKIGVSE